MGYVLWTLLSMYNMIYEYKWCMQWIVSYKLYNHTTIRPFKGDEFMHDEFLVVVYIA